MEPSVIHVIHTLQPIEETLNISMYSLCEISISHTLLQVKSSFIIWDLMDILILGKMI